MSPEHARAPGFTPLSTRGPSTETVSGYSAGYSAGWAAGTRAAARNADAERRRLAEEERVRAAQRAAETTQALAVLARAVEAAQQRAVPVLEEALQTLATAAVDLAEALLGAELSDGATSARTALRRALAATGEQDVVRVRLHPADHAQLTRTLHGTDATLPEGVELVADPELDRGDAVSELADGYLDARLGAAVARARSVLEAGR